MKYDFVPTNSVFTKMSETNNNNKIRITKKIVTRINADFWAHNIL